MVNLHRFVYILHKPLHDVVSQEEMFAWLQPDSGQ